MESTDEPVFGYCCACNAPGTFLVWNKTVTVGNFACSRDLWWVKKNFGGGGVERM